MRVFSAAIILVMVSCTLLLGKPDKAQLPKEKKVKTLASKDWRLSKLTKELTASTDYTAFLEAMAANPVAAHRLRKEIPELRDQQHRQLELLMQIVHMRAE